MTVFYIARQPILDRDGNTYGYELLFRSSNTNAYDPTVDGDTATSRVLSDAILESGIDGLVGNGYAFINLTSRFLENPDLLDALPPGRCVLEVLETVDVTDKVVEGVQALRVAGHLIALDDFVDEERFGQLLPLAHIIKYDITEHTMDELARYREVDEVAGRLSLAERVETYEEFESLSAAGFQYFQGYYFAKPRIVSGNRLPQNRMALMQLMAEVNNPDATIDELADIVSRDVSLSVRTLRYINSPLTGLRAEVTSIRHATVLVGRELIRNWVTLLIMNEMDEKPAELIKLALSRARFCQLCALEDGLADDAMYFTIGLLSLLDVLMDTELSEALEIVSVNPQMKDVLINRTGDGGKMLVLLENLEKHSSDCLLPENMLYAGPLYQQSNLWAEETSALV
jgi:EAL and modified HD-GYP domain-containing signal transduction protein